MDNRNRTINESLLTRTERLIREVANLINEFEYETGLSITATRLNLNQEYIKEQAKVILDAAQKDEKIIEGFHKLLDGIRRNGGLTLNKVPLDECYAYLEKQKENPKNADSIPSDCASNAKCENSWHKTANSLPDTGRDVLAKDALGNYLLASFDGAQWFVSVYDGQDHPVIHTPAILEWCDIPSEKQKEQKPGLEVSPNDASWEAYYQRGLNRGYELGLDAGRKEPKPTEELVYRLNGLMQEYIKDGKDVEEREHRFKCYHLFWDAMEDSEYFEQKEPEPLSTEETEMNSLAFLEEMGYTCIPPSKDGVVEKKIAALMEEQKPVNESGTAEPDYGICDDYVPAQIHWALQRHGWYACHITDNQDVIKERKECVERNWRDVVQEQNPVECISDSVKFDEGFRTGREVGFREGVESVKPVEWSKENIDKMVNERARKSGTTKTEMQFYLQGIEDTLKSLRPQQREDNDEEKIMNFFDAIGDCGFTQADILKLKSIWKEIGLPNPKPHWKPSGEQMSCLFAEVIKAKQKDMESTSGFYPAKVLESLYNDLKKLM